MPKLSLASWRAAQGAAERVAVAKPWLIEIVIKAANFKRIADEMEYGNGVPMESTRYGRPSLQNVFRVR